MRAVLVAILCVSAFVVLLFAADFIIAMLESQ